MNPIDRKYFWKVVHMIKLSALKYVMNAAMQVKASIIITEFLRPKYF